MTKQAAHEPTDAMVDAAASCIWNTLSARYAGCSFEQAPDNLMAKVEARAMAKEALRAALANTPRPIEDKGLRRVRHRKRGSLYDVLQERVEVQSSDPIIEGDWLTIYQAVEDRKVWARPTHEFTADRFGSVDAQNEMENHYRAEIIPAETHNLHFQQTDAVLIDHVESIGTKLQECCQADVHAQTLLQIASLARRLLNAKSIIMPATLVGETIDDMISMCRDMSPEPDSEFVLTKEQARGNIASLLRINGVVVCDASVPDVFAQVDVGHDNHGCPCTEMIDEELNAEDAELQVKWYQLMNPATLGQAMAAGMSWTALLNGRTAFLNTGLMLVFLALLVSDRWPSIQGIALSAAALVILAEGAILYALAKQIGAGRDAPDLDERKETSVSVNGGGKRRGSPGDG